MLIQFTTALEANEPKGTQLRESRTAWEYLKAAWNSQIDYKESFYILLLDRANKIIGFEMIAIGGTAAILVDAKCIFHSALLGNASSIILAHNHPSGNLTPSSADVSLTKKIKNGGKLLDIQVLDHLILGPSKEYFSFADEGRM